MPRLDRLTSILIQLQSKRIVTAKEIADRFEISLRTVYRDIRTLEQAGVPMISEPGIGYSIMKEYRLPPVHFTEDEAIAFVTAGKFLDILADSNIKKAYENALFKIKSVLSYSQKEWVDDLSTKLIVKDNDYLDKARNNQVFLKEFLQAIYERRCIRLQYFSVNSASEDTRVVEPIGVYFQGQYWYMVAWCTLRKAYRNFRMDRLKHFKILDQRFVSIHPDLPSFIEQTATEKQLTKVVVLIDKEAYRYMGDQHFYQGYIAQKDMGDNIEMQFLSSSLTGFAHWFMLLGESADILEPEELKQMVLDKLDKVKARITKPY